MQIKRKEEKKTLSFPNKRAIYLFYSILQCNFRHSRLLTKRTFLGLEIKGLKGSKVHLVAKPEIMEATWRDNSFTFMGFCKHHHLKLPDNPKKTTVCAPS